METQERYPRLAPEIENLATQIVDACYTVHAALGPGLLESVYETCLAHEFDLRGIPYRRQEAIPIYYGDLEIEAGFRADFIVGDVIIVELKAIEQILPVHRAQVLTYLRCAGLRLGFLVNFNVPQLRGGLKRVIR